MLYPFNTKRGSSNRGGNAFGEQQLILDDQKYTAIKAGVRIFTLRCSNSDYDVIFRSSVSLIYNRNITVLFIVNDKRYTSIKEF